MGNCSSCFGDRGRRDDYEDDEAQRLFAGDSLHYGSFQQQQHIHGEEDPEEARREIDALQGVVSRTSYNMIDVYDMMMPPDERGAGDDELYSQGGGPAQQHRPSLVGKARYQPLLSKLSVQGEDAVVDIDFGTPVDEDGPVELMHQRGGSSGGAAVMPIKLEGGDALVATFQEAAAAMR